ncbi:uncharacterized protein LOC106470708 [Limulus polyphemus]|uniref:Uncharacterized protein LOC106470708 n=1 Tax=Limulus polyphemus TaxID=6850 RepID=A0ABM1TGP4_LIMPO|nr:uncharacterized protein LOC106470708 [Limulus polyphemus]
MKAVKSFLEVLTLFYAIQVSLAEFVLRDEIVINGLSSLVEANCSGPDAMGFKEFEIEKFLGDWYEIFKTDSGFANLKSGLWRLEMTEDQKLMFTYSAEADDKHCINPVRGELQLTGDKPGEVILKYVRFNSRIEEKFQVIYLDETCETAVAYACYRHLSDGKVCDPRALYAAILSRKKSSQLPSGLSLVTQNLCIDRDLMIPQRPYNCDLNHYEPDDELDSEQGWESKLCHEHPDHGHCVQSQVKYYYNPLSGQCETFLYSGCGGNKNNFLTLQDCQEKCVDKTGTFMCPDTATCALACPLCCEEENGCIKCDCETTAKVPENVHSSLVPQDKLPFDPDCLGSPNDCPKTCAVIEFNVGCYKCDCNHSNVSKVDMTEAEHLSSDHPTPDNVHSSPVPQDRLPFDPDCLGSPKDCPKTCAVIEFNVGCYKCDCNHSNVSEVDMVEENNVHSSPVPQDKLPFDPDCLGSPNDCPKTCVVIEFNVGCYKCDCNHSNVSEVDMVEENNVHSSPVPQDKLPFDPDCLGFPNDCPKTCAVIEFNVGCYKCNCNHLNVSQMDKTEETPDNVHSSPVPQDKLPFDPDCLGSPNDCPKTCAVIEFNVGCYKCDCSHSNDSQVNKTEAGTTAAGLAHYEDIYPINKGSECLSSCRVIFMKNQLFCICNNLHICHQPKKVGFCRARKPRYYFNPEKGKCELFYYGGCGGNANRFTTLEECEHKCHGKYRMKYKK